MTKKVDDRLKSMCNKCQSILDKPCAWLNLGNEYCDEIMNIQNEIQRLNNKLYDKDEYIQMLDRQHNKDKNIIDELEKWLKEKQNLCCGCGITYEYKHAFEDTLEYLKELKEDVK